jgi:NADH:ubiquinone oxidoreductase subunit 5 (subunit L)/multisubunit Na+/H+ antiporter MnhA subunit
LSGFYSKDRILEAAWGHYSTMGHFTFWLTTAAALCTAVYSMLLLYWVFLSDTQAYKTVMQRAHEADEWMLTPFRVLMLCSVTSGFLLKDAFGGLGSDFLKESVAVSSLSATVSMTSEFVPLYVKILPTVGTLVASVLALVFYHSAAYTFLVKAQMWYRPLQTLHFFLVKKWGWDIVYNRYVATNIFGFGGYLYITVDQGYLESYGPQGLARGLSLSAYPLWAQARRPIFAILTSFCLAVLVLGLVFYGHYWYVCFDTWLTELVGSGVFKGTILEA